MRESNESEDKIKPEHEVKVGHKGYCKIFDKLINEKGKEEFEVPKYHKTKLNL